MRVNCENMIFKTNNNQSEIICMIEIMILMIIDYTKFDGLKKAKFANIVETL